jgi:hypothetical protein
VVAIVFGGGSVVRIRQAMGRVIFVTAAEMFFQADSLNGKILCNFGS